MSAPFQPAQALLLAAGRGNRMRPLTDHTPKPLLAVQGRPLIEWPMRALAAQGFAHVLINTGWLGQQLPARFGRQYAHGEGLPDTRLTYSREDIDFGGALETAGGIVRALPQLDDVFWLAAGDALAHLWLVPNPAHNPAGDFALDADGRARDTDTAKGGSALPRHTYSTMGLFKKALFAAPYCNIPAGNPQGVVAPLAPVLRAGMAQGRISASLYTGRWADVGTPQRLAELNEPLA